LLAKWDIDREIVLSRVINAPRELVFSAYSDPRHLPQWFGPSGFKIATHEIDIREGGLWRFEMTAPNGQTYSSRMVFLRIDRPYRIVLDHGKDQDDDPTRFRVIMTFDEQSDGKTIVTLRQLHPSRAQRDATIGFGAVELGYHTLDKLAQHVERMRT
jgi:uncharacterized protein YndB with AHSA1/START domain